MLNNKGFDLWADGYDKTVKLFEENNQYPFAGYKKVLNTIYKEVRVNNAVKILDIGFGTGTLTKKLYDDGIEITGIDFSPKMIEIAQEKMPKAKLIECDFSKTLPDEITNDKFDCIICTYAIHHLEDEKKIALTNQLIDSLNDHGIILYGDVMFETLEELNNCKKQEINHWDEDEIYLIYRDFSKHFKQSKFIQVSYCSGVCIIQK